MIRLELHRRKFVLPHSVAAFLCFSVLNSSLHATPPLPPESQLPAAAFPVPVPGLVNGAADKKTAATPDEGVLPGEQAKSQSAQPADVKDFPDESTLPGETTVDADPQGVDGVPVDNALGERSPWLRMDLKGHTGTIRAVDVSQDDDSTVTLVTAGEDKDVHVWQRGNITKNQWVHRRTVRWPIVRGPRGRVYSISIRGNEIAFAGHGSTGGLGEIWIVNSTTGNLVRSLTQGVSGQAHRQTISTLRWSPTVSPTGSTASARLASVDVEGCLMVWQADSETGLWSGRELVRHDIETYGAETATALRVRRRFVPLTFLGEDQVVVARYVGIATQPAGAARWELVRINIDNAKSKPIEQSELIEFVIALDASDDGRTLLASDAMGTTKRFRFNDSGELIDSKTFGVGGVPLFMDVGSEGRRALIGGTVTIGQNQNPNSVKPGQMQVWDLEPDVPIKLSTVALDDIPLSGVQTSSAVADTQRQVIVAAANRLAVHEVDQPGKLSETPEQMLRTDAGSVTRVAFTKQIGEYTIAFAQEGADFTDQFDLSQVKLIGRQAIDREQFLSSQRLAARWTARLEPTEEGPRYRLFRDQQPQGRLPLIPELHGTVTSVSTLSAGQTEDPATGKGAVVVGTGSRNDIYLYAADDSDPPKLIRHFRGHTGDVLTTSASADGRYMVSGSTDTTMSIWNLEGVFDAGPLINRWGVDFEIESDRLIAASVREEGPLHFRGVRTGDRLTSIRWADRSGVVFAESDPTRMLAQLGLLPFDTLVVFEFSRRGRALLGFQSFAAWHPLATLFIDRTREWAFWTPAGFYDASFNGHRRFGWQINRGVDRLPDFYRAAQFRKSLERPEVMRRLLKAGSLPAAMRESVSGIEPPPGDTAIVNQIETQPTVRITQPFSGELVDGDRLTVRAQIDIPGGGQLAPPKAFVNGIPASQSTTLTETPNQITMEWNFRLPHRSELHVEVLAATEAEAVGRATISLRRKLPEHPPRPPRMHLLAIGVGDYRDPQIQSLDFAGRATSVVADTFRKQSSSIYRVSADQLVDRDATGSLWRVYAQAAAERLAGEVGPDDLVVMYLCGHGLRDRRTNRWYFVTADAKYRDLMNDQYHDCMSDADLALFSKLPCTKLAILDSCHSGAVQTSMRADDLKSALRFLQEDVVITWTASEGDEEAVEQRENRLGRFTNFLIEALAGQADIEGGDADGIVSLQEAIAYVSSRVSDESESEGKPQHPTAGPRELIEQIDLPLARVPR